ncbi:hypothetical protein D9Q98_001637 [Chlorella vulgaris]|uniref:Protein kinase domain-containing protein n=1 Tax=Chlorella vulgaris TaxID=3077 RepID=A0A9D4Z0G0_CHLVU|nr:hypothetical protein D9Q98_001637 [Chlorella vulgaris]
MRRKECPLVLLKFFLLLPVLQAASVPDAALADLWCRYGLAGCVLQVNASAEVAPALATWEQGGNLPQPVLAASHPARIPSQAATAEAADVGHQQAPEPQAIAQPAALSSSAQTSQPETSRILVEAGSNAAASVSHSMPGEWPGTYVFDVYHRAATLAGMAARAAAAGLALAPQAAWSAVAVASRMPLWAFLLLGAFLIAAAGVQIFIRMPKQALLRRLSDLEAAAVSAVFEPKVVQLRQAAARQKALHQSNGSVDMEAGAVVQSRMLPAAAVQGMEQDVDEEGAAGEGEESALDTTPSPGSSCQAEAVPHTPAISVDPSVRFRDMSKRAWVHASGAEAQPSIASRQAFEARPSFLNPLFVGSGSGASSPGSTLASPSIPAGSAGLHGEEPAVLASDQGWAAVASSGSHVADMNYDAPGALTLPASDEQVGNNACGTQVEPSVPQVIGSPGQLPRGQALRKLTGARTIQPVDLAGLDLDAEQALRQEHNYGGDSSVGNSSGDMGLDGCALGSSSIERVPALGTTHRPQRCPNDTAKRHRLAPATRPGLRLLTARQFKDQVHMSKLLGVGASGCVYAATWEGQQVAVKMLHPTTVDEGAFAREVSVMAALDHPSIIRVMAACLELPLAVIQELGAGTLHDQLHQRHCRPQYGLFMQLAEDVAAALAHCHSQRPPVVHRDLSARNVLLGMDGRARLADFGLAAAKRRTYLSLDKTAALGTAAYMSPEAMQAGQISERTDVYSYGVLLWELLTGREAWEECVSPMQIIFAVAVERRRPAIPSGCPPAIARLLKECWRHNAPLRPSFAEIVSRLSKMRSQSMLLQLQPAVRHTQPVSLAFKGPAISPYSKAGAPGRPLKPHAMAH